MPSAAAPINLISRCNGNFDAKSVTTIKSIFGFLHLRLNCYHFPLKFTFNEARSHAMPIFTALIALLFLEIHHVVRALNFDFKRIDDMKRDTGGSGEDNSRPHADETDNDYEPVRRNLFNAQHSLENQRAAQQKKRPPSLNRTNRHFRINLCTITQYTGESEHVNRFKRTAERSRLFDRISVYTHLDVPAEVGYEKLAIPQRSVYGHKILKPQAIMLEMRHSDPSDVIVYAEISSSIHQNSVAEERFAGYIDNLLQSTSKRLGFSVSENPEFMYTKADVLEIFSFKDAVTLEMPQITSDVLFMVNTKENKELMQVWYEIMIANDFQFLLKSGSRFPNPPQFVQHNCETSILSCLLKTEGVFIEEDPPAFDVSYPIVRRKPRT